MMLALNLGERITQRFAEVLVRRHDGAVELELDDGLHPADCGDLGCLRHAVNFLRGDVGRNLHDLDGLAITVEHRIIGRLDPDLATAFCDPLEFAGLEFAAVQRRPERLVIGAVTLIGRHEHGVLLSLDLIEGIAEGVQEILVGGQDRAVHPEFDHGLRMTNGGELRFRITARLEPKHQ